MGAGRGWHRGRIGSLGRVTGVLGLALAAVGLLLFAGAGLYYVYGVQTRSGLDELEFPPLEQSGSQATAPDTEEQPSQQGPVGTQSQTPAPPGVTIPDPVPYVSPTSPSLTVTNETPPEPPPAAATRAESASPPDPATQPLQQGSDFGPLPYAAVYPGVQIHPKYWGEPLWAGTDTYSPIEEGLPDGYRAVSYLDFEPGDTSKTEARRILIPLIDVDSVVAELQVLDLGDSRTYETPKNVVGHIPTTPNPGDLGNGWYFGHLASPIRGEGNVFGRLPELPQHLRNGDSVYVAIESAEGEYLYLVTTTRVVHEDELHIYDSGDATVTLVACVPKLIYDHRLLITAMLVGTRDGDPTRDGPKAGS